MLSYDQLERAKLPRFAILKQKHCLWLICLLLLLLRPASVEADEQAQEPKLILLNLARVDFSDLTTPLYPNFEFLLANGGVGLISTRIEGALTPEKVYTTLISSSAVLPISAGLPTVQGLIGSALHQAGKKTAALGHSDLPWRVNQSARLMLADRQGIIDWELTGRELQLTDPEFPFGYRTDYRLVAEEIQRLLPDAHLILVEPGDLERLEGYRRMLSDARFVLLRRESLQRIDALVGDLLTKLPEGTVLCLFSAGPSSLSATDDPFLPLLVYEKKGEAGVISSRSTRQKGLVTMGDFITGLLSYLTGQNQGDERRITIEQGNWQELAKKKDYWLNNLAQRKIILRIYIGLLLTFLVLSALLTFVSWPKLTLYIQAILPGLAAVPLTLMLVASFQIRNLGLLTFLLVGGTGGLWLLYRKIGRTTLRAYRWLLISTAGLILFDLLSGAGMMGASLLGPSPVLGARFYGLGNEYLGIFLGSLLVGATGLLIGSRGRRWSGLWLGACSLVLFSPLGGANFGGGVCMSFAALQICRRLSEKEEVRRNLSLFLLVLSGGLLYFLLKPVGGNTHLNDALQLLSTGRRGLLLEMVGRKLRMNWGLINYHPGIKLFLFSFILLFIFQKLAGKSLLFTKIKNEWYWPGISMVVDTGLVALLVNDSGITVLGTMLLYPLLLLSYLLLSSELPNLMRR